MKRLTLLIAMILLSCSSISQTVTVENKTDVLLNKRTSKAVILDLIKGDAAQEKLTVANQIIAEKDKQLLLQKDIAGELESKVTNLEAAVRAQKEVITLHDKVLEEKNTALQTRKNSTLIYKITTLAAILAAIGFAVSN